MPNTLVLFISLALALPAPALADDAAAPLAPASADATTLDAVVVEGARLPALNAFDIPASATVLSLDAPPAHANADAAEVLRGIPGVLARDRQNLAQDTQLSIRGFGARSTFGVRGVRLYADGIPASMPDGQGQLSHFALAGAERIEVLRGPFSALHGNASGGVVQLWSADGEAGDPWQLRAAVGADGMRTGSARLLGGSGGGGFGYNLALSHFATDGWRDHARARRDIANLKLRFEPAPGHRVDVVANAVDIPDAQDPLGLDREQLRADPRQAVANAHVFDTRKRVGQEQLGVVYSARLTPAQTLRVATYGGGRDVVQYLAIPVATQSAPTHAGGVIDLDNRYHGADLRWTWQGEFAGRALSASAGLNADRQRQHRQGFENFVGETVGVRGAQRRDERNRAGNNDAYAQAWWRLADRWSLLAGLRHSEIEYRSHDHYVTGANPDDSGRVRYRNTAPVAGLAFAPRDDARLYLSAGRGFETPTFNELSYRADGEAGLAFDLAPAVSDHVELGAKWRGAGGQRVEAALFRADTDDELAVARNAGGRSSYRNAGRARRQGAELSALWPLGEAWTLQLAATWLDATFRDTTLVCSGFGCTLPATPLPAGTRIPGVPERQSFARLSFAQGPWQAALEAEAIGNVGVDDLASERAAGYGLLHLEGGHRWQLADGGALRMFARVDNLLDRDHVASVIVNDGNGRYYEPGGGRGWLLGLEWRFARD